MLRRKWIFSLLTLMALLALVILPVAAQDEQPNEGETEPTKVPVPLSISTTYPSQVIGMGETINFSLSLGSDTANQVVSLDVQGLPEGWTANFRGAGRIVNSVYVDTEGIASVDLRVEPPDDEGAGTFQFTVIATGDGTKAELELELTVEEKLPPSLSLEIDLPTLRGTPSTNFNYSVRLVNDGDDELLVNLSAEAPAQYLVTFRLSGQEVTEIPVGSRETKSLSVEAKPIGEVSAGTYPITLLAQGGEVQASLQLEAEVTGQAKLTVTAPDGRLSGQAYAGRETPLKIVVSNTGTASARGVTLSSSESSGWAVSFDQPEITEIPAGQQVEVTANIRPAEKAVAGDYIVTVRANSAEGLSSSAEFRITVRTSTLWGIVGIALIAIAVGVVAMAVMRFGRR